MCGQSCARRRGGQGNPRHCRPDGRGAPRSGVYHYSGIGEVTAYSFMETVLANASQYQPFEDARELMELVTVEDEPATSLSPTARPFAINSGYSSLAGGSLFPVLYGATLISTQKLRKGAFVGTALKTAVLTVSDTRTLDTDTSGAFLRRHCWRRVMK